MPIKDYLEETAVFRLEDLMEKCGDTASNANLLSRAVRAGKARRVKAGVYVSNTGRYKNTRPDKLAVASVLAPDACVCHLTALSLYAGEQNVMFSATLYSNILRSPVEFDGITYRPYRYPSSGVETMTKRLKAGISVRTTTKEQSVLDSLHRPSRCLGTEGVLRTAGSILRLDGERLAELSMARSASACAKAGWLLEEKSSEWEIDKKTLAALHARIGSGPHYFDGKDRPNDSYDPKWKLYFPEPLETIKEWVRG